MRKALSQVCWYARLRPDELQDRINAMPVAFVPWGALEWHSAHLPVGLDGLVAETVAARAAEQLGAVVLPTFYLPITALPHQFSISLRAITVRAVLDDLLSELARAGFQVVVVLSGHYAQGHELVLIDAAEAALQQHGLLVLATPPLALVDDKMLDHAGHWETSALLASYPELVDMRQLRRALQAFPAGHIGDIGIIGEIPLATATAAAGEVAIEQAVAEIRRLVASLLSSGDPTPLQDYYARRRAVYQSFVDRYFDGSWEDAAARWWDDITKR
ncbi:MAG: creatininase family protein [Chloroflexota bacterium]|nr:creatininase family protein [Chloroflexota bacterium]